jgi:hypothetical protein
MDGQENVETSETPDTEVEAPETPDTDTDTDGDGDAEADAAPAPKPDAKTDEPNPLFTWGESEWAKTLLEEQDADGKTFAVTKDEIAALPLDAKRILAATFREAREAEGKIKGTLEQARQTLAAAEQREQAALMAQADALRWLDSDKVKKFAEATRPKGEQPDPETPEGVKWMVANEFANMAEKWLESISGARKEHTDALAATKAKAASDAHERAVLDYINKPENAADFDKTGPVYPRILALMKDTGFKLPLQRVHMMVRAEMEAEELARTHSADQKEARARVQRGGNRGEVIPEMPEEFKGDSAAELDWYEKNPKALKRDLERHRKSGDSAHVKSAKA